VQKGLNPSDPSSDIEISEKDALLEYEKADFGIGLAAADSGSGKM
jgi:hypothetical protein